MLIAKNISKSIGSKTLFEKVGFSLAPGERVALVGENGSGKSTFLRILAGLEAPDAGSFSIQGERLAYVPQELSAAPGETIGSVLGGKEHSALSRLAEVGMESFALAHPAAELSGGQKTRVMIARALLLNPTILLLDEPTNHLDREGVDWIRDFLRSFRGIVFCVSHDRELLEDMTRIVEIYPQDHSFDFYVGGWKEYQVLRKEKRRERQDAYDEQQAEKKRLEEYLKWRTAQATRSSNPNLGAQVRMLKKRLEREIYSQELARPKDTRTISDPTLLGSVHDSKLLLDFREVTFSLGEKTLLYKISFQIRGKERVILAGKNGSGKSTILKIAMGLLKPESGEARIGANVRIGYFAQQHEILDLDETVQQSFENTDRLRKDSRDSRSILAGFLFADDALRKKVGDLSPGERVRLIFAKLIHQENEFLLLDEPTNHLDIQSKEVIEQALADFEGGILAVSHDPYFIQAIGTVREIRIEKGNIAVRLM